jgi:hypothetical protein
VTSESLHILDPVPIRLIVDRWIDYVLYVNAPADQVQSAIAEPETVVQTGQALPPLT